MFVNEQVQFIVIISNGVGNLIGKINVLYSFKKIDMISFLLATNAVLAQQTKMNSIKYKSYADYPVYLKGDLGVIYTLQVQNNGNGLKKYPILMPKERGLTIICSKINDIYNSKI